MWLVLAPRFTASFHNDLWYFNQALFGIDASVAFNWTDGSCWWSARWRLSTAGIAYMCKLVSKIIDHTAESRPCWIATCVSFCGRFCGISASVCFLWRPHVTMMQPHAHAWTIVHTILSLQQDVDLHVLLCGEQVQLWNGGPVDWSTHTKSPLPCACASR